MTRAPCEDVIATSSGDAARVTLEIREEPPSALADYGRVPIAFEVRERLAVAALGAPSAGRWRARPPC